MTLTWILETGIFSDGHKRLADAVERAGHEVVRWNDGWWSSESHPTLEGPAVFHGSLGNADRVVRELGWTPGGWCRTKAFYCSAYFPGATPWLVHPEYCVLPACELAGDPQAALERLGSPDRVFVRPDSPLKPFSGRVLEREAISLAALDHGFYFDDETTPVVIAPVLELGMEWRFVVVDGRVVTGSGYDPEGRRPNGVVHAGSAWDMAETIVAELPAPEAVFVLDVCEHEDAIRLIELNPFSGADLYDCDRDRIVAAMGEAVLRNDSHAET